MRYHVVKGLMYMKGYDEVEKEKNGPTVQGTDSIVMRQCLLTRAINGTMS